jgi:iron complex transport system ATP-binding protein
MPEPALLLLDEPAAGLDLPGRELVLASVRRLATARPELASATVTHHLEELPATTTHALLLRDGVVVAAGPADAVLVDETLSACFGLSVRVEANGGRYVATATA